MSIEKELFAIFESGDVPLKIGDLSIDCYVLNNGTRVLSQTGMLKALSLKSGTGSGKGADRLVSFAMGKRLKPFISSELIQRIEKPIIFKTKRGSKSYGYDAIMLQEIVRGVCKAYLTGSLQKQQEHIGIRAEILDDGFSKTGILALIDEATGYTHAKERAKDELQQFLSSHINLRAAKWVKQFQDDFFESIFKMKGWNWRKSGSSPSVMGYYINDLVYSRFAPYVLQVLKQKNPYNKSKKRRGKKHHQFLTDDVAKPKLRAHIAGLVALAKASSYDWDAFKKLVDKAFPVFGETLKIPFPVEIEEKTASEKKTKMDKKLSEHNKSLKKALDYNPKKEKPE